ncbi:MAG TPA: hypothetical protein PKV27_04300, partial [Ilumatobacteraceae bacterium]|nr:hypothetical protein [Ilumatobacteraceae bacterium]
MRDRRHSQHHDGPTADRRGSFADPGGVNEDAYGFWNDEPTRSLRSLIPARQSGQRRSRRHNDTAPIEHVDADPTPIAAYDPWLDDDLSTASFGAHEPTTGSYRYGTMAGSAGTRGTGGWDVADDVYDDDFEVDAATPLATVSAARSTAIDPLLKRVGLMVGAMALLVPIGMAARGSDKPSSSLTSPPSSIEPSPATGPSAVPISADGSSSASSSSDAYGARALAITIAPPSSQPSPSSDPSTIASTSGSAAAAATTGAGAASRPAAAKTVAANPICGYSSYKVAAGDFWVSIASAANVR